MDTSSSAPRTLSPLSELPRPSTRTDIHLHSLNIQILAHGLMSVSITRGSMIFWSLTNTPVWPLHITSFLSSPAWLLCSRQGSVSETVVEFTLKAV